MQLRINSTYLVYLKTARVVNIYSIYTDLILNLFFIFFKIIFKVINQLL